MEMAIIILAAGQSKRMRGLDKLTQKISGLPQIQRITLLACQVSAKVIVALPDAAHPRSICLLGLPIERRFILNSQSGMGYSLASAASMLKKSLHSGVMVIPADMPDLTREDIELLVAAHQKNPEVIAQAISTNGMAVAAATEDDEAVRICNKLISSGAIAAGITGSGPAISVISFVQDSEIIRQSLNDLKYDIVETNFFNNNILELI